VATPLDFKSILHAPSLAKTVAYTNVRNSNLAADGQALQKTTQL
jgi:hypothetical protein